MKFQTPKAHSKALDEPWRPNPSQIVLFAFLGFIVIGASLLAMPFAHAGAPHDWVDDLFVAASAVCVTGLVPVDPGTSYSLWGQVVIMLLMQMGGLGYMTLFTLSLLLIGKRLSMRDRVAMKEITERPGMAGMVGYFKSIVLFTLVVEGLGTLALATSTVPEFGWLRGGYLALFHSVSAFNNGGISLLPDGAMHWQGHWLVLLTLCALALIGGLGYNVNHELVNRFLLRKPPNREWDILLRIVLTTTAVLLVGSTLLFWFFESNNPRTIGGMSWFAQLINSFFIAVQPRSSGFNCVDLNALERPTLMVTMGLMFIGAGPGGTAGGIKLTTVAIILATILAVAQGRDEVPLFNFKRTVSEKNVRKAFTVLAVSLGMVALVTVSLGSLEPHVFLPLLFEAISAFGTVGLSMGITGQLSDAGKLILVAAMLIGRVGVLVIMLSLITQRRKTSIHYMEEPLLVG